MAESITVDLCVIGGGRAGLAAVAEARRIGASVALVERDRLGGRYLNRTTIPTHALSAAAAHAHAMRGAAPFGIAAEAPRLNARRLYDGIQEVVGGLAPTVSAAHLEATGVRVIGAEARFADARTLLAGEDRITARAFIIATGARSVSPSLPGLENTPYFTAETIFDNTRRLTHLLVVGAGANGLELAQAYNRLGTEVTVVASDGGHPFAGLDPDLGDVVVQQMREEGVSIRPDSSVVELQARSQGIGVIVRTGGSDERLDVSHILVDAGRIPDVDALDLERAGVRRDATDGRALALSANLRTSNRRIYAIGGAAGVPERASLDAAQAAAVVRHALLLAPFRIHAAEAPVCYFTDPEVATIGLSETAARASKGEAFEVLRASFADNARAHATRRTYGLVKLIVGRDGGLLGAGIVGDRAGELITTLALAMSQRLKVGQLDRLLAPHPTLSETFVALARDYSRSGGVGLVERRLLSLRRYLP